MSKPENSNDYYANLNVWKSELSQLRKIVLTTKLVEVLKWGMPTYQLIGENVLTVSANKTHFGILFFQSVFLKDKSSVLSNMKEGKVDRPVSFELSSFLKNYFLIDKELENHFNNLTKGKQKEFSNYIAEAKRDTTKKSRLIKIIPLIEKGVSLNDKYKK